MFGFRLAEQAALASLRNAMEERGIRRLQKSIAECKKLKFAPRELAQAEQLLPQLEVRLFPCSCRYLAWWSLSRSLSLAFLRCLHFCYMVSFRLLSAG